MNNEITGSMLATWLKKMGTSREEFAGICNVSKRTIDGWCSSGRKIPSIAQTLIHKIMREQSAKELKFNYDEWQKVNHAMDTLGYTDFYQFATDAIRNHFEESIQKTEFLAAEESTEYTPAKNKTPKKVVSIRKAQKQVELERRADEESEAEYQRLLNEQKNAG